VKSDVLKIISIKEKANYSLLYFYAFFMVLIFNVNSTSNRVNVISVFHTEFNMLIIIFGICMFFSMLSLLRRPFINYTALALLCAAVLGLIPLMYYKNTENYWGNYIPLLVSLASFYICMKSKGDFTEKVYKTFCFVSVVISLQVIITEFHFFNSLSFSNFSNVAVKTFISIPIGDSNLIAAYLLPLIVFIFSYRNNLLGVIISGVSLYALVLCRSKNAISLAVLIIFISLYKKLYCIIIKKKSIHFLIVPLIVIFAILFVGVLNIIGMVISDLQFPYISTYTNSTLNYLDSITSGRIIIFENEFMRFLNHPFFGNGFGYSLGQIRSHNWILELLVQRGLFGAIIYLFCIVKVIKNGFLFYYTDKFANTCINMLGVIYLQGLLEITVFTIGVDFLIWSISGFLFARIRYLSKFSNMPLINQENNKYKSSYEKIFCKLSIKFGN